ncbi:PIN domain-containing protein [Acaryochloris sp. CCMEE 5410]|uniref:type II toxin-antitoxin system VapC family toxin n=1 Tax=Acaryochloris sp. CCMEE 5410 TaxID=310037 RepID=UPI0002484483|nr:PIN domain-containing protein [Acaryochloris sp. CCMEE 5410]KAI9134019.1 PIN domain-containing protein [Acaryochloris sp. CCMEE 5410]
MSVLTTFVAIDGEITVKAAQLRVQYSLKLPDALQLATAIVSGCDGFLTNDFQLKKVAKLQVLVVDELEV